MREVVKSVECNCGKIEIYFPSLSKEEIYLMVQFLYTGKISNLSANKYVVAEVLDNLIQLLGFPNCMLSTKGTPYFSSEKTKEFDENMEFVKTIQFDEKVEFDENMEFGKNIELDKIRDKDTIDPLEDFSSNIFRNEKGGANITEENQ